MKMETQIKILKKIAPSINKEIQDMQSQILSQLEGKLKTASLTIEQLMKQNGEEQKAKKELWKHDDRGIGTMIKDLGDMTGLKKVKYTNKKASLIQIVDDIERWQVRYDPTWILIMQMSIGNIDEELDEQQKKPDKDQIPIVIAAKGIRDAIREGHKGKSQDQGPIWIDVDKFDLKPSLIPFSSIHMSLTDWGNMVLVDTMISNPAANVTKTIKEVRNLARILTQVEPKIFGLLKCRGVIQLPRASPEPTIDFRFIFEVPRNLSNPQSLRAVLLAGNKYPLDERLELAKRLISSVLFVHTVQFVHKNIRPETIIIFENDASKIGAQFLAGFEQFRLEDGTTYRVGDGRWEYNLCMYIFILLTPLTMPDRHISRQGLYPEMDYQMQHDIYSLGVVLLEIGLWKSFVVYDSEGQSASSKPNSILGAESTSSSSPIGNALVVKNKLETLAESKLPARMGKRYTDIVLSCLRCLDPGTGTDRNGKGFGVDIPSWKDEDGIVIGVRYIENILDKIQEITI